MHKFPLIAHPSIIAVTDGIRNKPTLPNSSHCTTTPGSPLPPRPSYLWITAYSAAEPSHAPEPSTNEHGLLPNLVRRVFAVAVIHDKEDWLDIAHMVLPDCKDFSYSRPISINENMQAIVENIKNCDKLDSLLSREIGYQEEAK